MSAGTHEFTVTGTELLLESPILGVRRDSVVMPEKTNAYREVVEHFGAVAVVAVNDRGQLAMVRQYRHSVKSRLWELPAGLLDMAGESELPGAQRELAEEAGLAAGQWSVLVDMVTSPGFCDEAVRVFLATDLTEVERPPAEFEEADMELTWLDLADARRAILEGRIVNSIAIAGIFAASEVLAGRGVPRGTDAPFEYRPTGLAARRREAGVGPDMKKMG
ncbi:NUDIX domain-containing protein [Corynebacterium guangdongense]|uniref:ADP-ribose pyrophosphatase n=1 Tax=Corynebacterium guangdongense TaxID=1783348 RepID=A0ABU1ZWI3_9CORY|nr:NUDIX hydrolase [Corynebacterium guangdongense]MDR7329276.1 ADP-ribose pyrophosphatase [Corynebacterium guangdongense]WJZ17842.1 ADP-ribose pyrophosphatase [Corynebacterium guangdongense]